MEHYIFIIMETKKHIGMLVDLFADEIYGAEITIEDGKIASLEKTDANQGPYILPGLVDAHIHIESSMLTPQQFARIAVSHGTVATVSDPHEIANVLGIAGVEYMIENSKGAQMKFFFGAPSCVPATSFESAGASVTANEIEFLFKNQNLLYLSEVMNYPGVIYGDEEVLRKIQIAKKYNKRIDGHAPGLSGNDLKTYIDAGVETDHECSGIEEAVEKIEKGMVIQIREGSAAKNFEALWPLVDRYPEKVLLCSDDLHPDDLVEGHINKLLKKGVEKKINLFNLLRAVSHNPIQHYKLELGLLRVGDRADFIKVEDLKSFSVAETYIEGKKVYDSKAGLGEVPRQMPINKFKAEKIKGESLIVPPKNNRVKVIVAEDGELVTKSFTANLKGTTDLLSDTEKDILKLVVLNRYQAEPPAIAFIKNFNLKKGAIASSIAHDSHNIIATGVKNDEIAECINWIISKQGGIAIHTGTEIFGIPLPVAGIISDLKGETVAEKYKQLNNLAKESGCGLRAPFMTLSFMALLVIPELKLSNKGLFDGRKFVFTSLYEN